MTAFPKWLDCGNRPHLVRALAQSDTAKPGEDSPFFPLVKEPDDLNDLLPTNNAAFEIVLREIMELLEQQDNEDPLN